MILTRKSDYIWNGKERLFVGSRVLATESDYAGLKGHITEIRTGKDKETENTCDDVYCCFEYPESNKEIKLLEEHFSSLYGEKKSIDDLGLDLVIMAPSELRTVAKNE